jgi:hypothetical protein
MGLGKWIRGWRLDKIFTSKKQEDIELRSAAEIAVILVEKLKNYIDNPVADLLGKIIPGDWDTKAIQAVRTKLPAILSDLRGIESTTDVATALNDIKFSNDDGKNRFYHNLATAAARVLSDGKLSYGDAVIAVQLIYDNTKNEGENKNDEQDA